MVFRLSRSWMLASDKLGFDVGRQAGGFQKALVGRGGNGEALGHRQADAVADLAQVGHLAAHRRGQVLVQGRQGQDKRGVRDGGDRLQDSASISCLEALGRWGPGRYSDFGSGD